MRPFRGRILLPSCILYRATSRTPSVEYETRFKGCVPEFFSPFVALVVEAARPMEEKKMAKTEDQVRSHAEKTLGFDDGEKDVVQGVGQITTFNQLGFKGKSDKPDGWYLPKDKGKVAIVLETKAEGIDIAKKHCANELMKNVAIVGAKYSLVVGILYNGDEVRVFKNAEEFMGGSPKLEHKDYYLRLFVQNKIDKQRIYTLTKRINDCLHFQFGIKNLYHRMIFTACTLVAKRYGANIMQGMQFVTLKSEILSTLNKSLEESRKQNLKLDLLCEVYRDIKMNSSTNQEALDGFIRNIIEISECVNSDYWNGEDVMGIFFNEFNRYKRKSESGQIFTPDHITSFMYRLIDVNPTDYVLDAACGSGAFLVKAMCNMIKASGGVNTNQAKRIKAAQLYGIEFDREIFALACANMLIHKDGKTNLEQLDSCAAEACAWIRSKKITKVMMNPPYENKNGCMKIVGNVLDNVPAGTLCAFILPDKKLEKASGWKLLKRHTLQKIVKMPEDLFFNVGVTTSIFVFEAGRPQNVTEPSKLQNGKGIVCYYIEEDGLVTVKNQGRQDIKNRWQEKEDYWITAIHNGDDQIYGTKKIIRPAKDHLSYPVPEKPFEIYEEDFIKTMMDYELFKRGIDAKAFGEGIMQKVLYASTVADGGDSVTISIRKGDAR